MGHRSIVLLVGALCAFAASHVSALGLGKITLDSSLNQPLSAKIELLELKDLTKEEIKVQIADREDFDRIGIEKTYFLTDLKFDVVLEGPGAPYINVNSRKLVREPFLNFIVQLRWPSGKVLREYTLLLDLPVFAGQQAPSVQASQQAPRQQASQAPSSQQSYQPSPAETGYNPRSAYEDAPARPAQSEVVPTYTEDNYRVRSNDTLWEIAAAVRPDSGVSIHQTMLAIQRENPQAFINNNINLLKAGQILRIPDREEMSDVAQRSAIREVAQQNAEWSGRDSSAEVSDAPLSASNVYSSSSEDVDAPEGRLTLSSPDDAYDSNEGRSSGSAADSSTEALESELAVTMEQLDSASRENQDLRSKVSSLEEQIETMERMLEVSNESMRALELAAKKQEEEEAAAAEVEESQPEEIVEEFSEEVVSETEETEFDSESESATEELAIGEVDVETEAEIDTESLSDALQEGLAGEEELDAEVEETVEEEVAEATPEPTPTAKPVVVPPTAQKSIVDLILENILFIVGGIVVLAAGVFFLLRKKEDDADDFFEEHGLNDLDETTVPDDDTVIQNRDSGDADDELSLGDLEDDGEEAPSMSEFEDELSEEEGEGEAQTEDVVTEADIYIAYGRFDRAEEMLLNALAKESNDENVRLKLLEVYSTQGDAENFDPHYAKLRAFASDETIERADALRANIPHIAEFDESSFDTDDVAGAVEVEDAAPESAEEDFDVSLDLDIPESGDDAAADDISLDLEEEMSLEIDGDSGSESDSSFDLDLGDLDSDGDPDAGLELELPDESEIEDATAETGDDLGEGLDLDFDLDDSSDSSGDDLDSLDLDLGESLDVSDSSEGTASTDLDDLDSDLDFDIEGDSDLGDLDADLSLDLDSPAEAADLSGGDLGGDLDDSLSLDLDAEPELDTDFGNLSPSPADAPEIEGFETDLGSDLDSGDDLSLDLGDESESEVSSDTVVNEALNDEYIEQKLSEDADLDMNLDADLPLETEEPQLSAEFESATSAPEPAAEEAAENDDLALDSEDDELDLSTLDQELDALTADVDADEIPTMEEPLTDLDAFDDDLERNEAEAEVVSTGAEPEKPVEDMGEDTMFRQAISETPDAESNFEIPEVSADDVDDDDLDFLSDSDETATKLDLARAYIDMGDQEGARDIIREIMEEGNDEQKAEAAALLERI